MKKLMTITLVAVIVLAGTAPYASAAQFTSPAKTVTANVPSTLSLNIVLKRNDFAGTIIQNMDFGNLVDIGTGTLRSSPTGTTGTGAVYAAITPVVQGGLPYTITQDGSPMSNGTTTLPTGPLVVKAVYEPLDQTPSGSPQPAGSTTPTQAGASWVGTRTLYTSGGTGAIRTVTAFYSITDDALAGSTGSVPTTQAPGSYTGTVTFTLTA